MLVSESSTVKSARKSAVKSTRKSTVKSMPSFTASLASVSTVEVALPATESTTTTTEVTVMPTSTTSTRTGSAASAVFVALVIVSAFITISVACIRVARQLWAWAIASRNPIVVNTVELIEDTAQEIACHATVVTAVAQHVYTRPIVSMSTAYNTIATAVAHTINAIHKVRHFADHTNLYFTGLSITTRSIYTDARLFVAQQLITLAETTGISI